MTSTASQRLRLDKQATGDNPDAWGQRLNTVIDLVDEAFGFAEIAVSSNILLTTQNFASDQARRAVLRFTGPGGFSVTIPPVEKWYYIDNRCAADVILKTADTAGSTVLAGSKRIAYCDGATVNTDTTTGGSAAATSFSPPSGVLATNAQDALLDLYSARRGWAVNAISSSTSLTAAALGQSIYFNPTTSITVRLPPVSTWKNGRAIEFFNSSQQTVNIIQAGPDNSPIIRANRDIQTTSFLLRPSESCTVICDANLFFVLGLGPTSDVAEGARRQYVGGTYILAASLAVTTNSDGEASVVFPWAFPNGCTAITVTNGDTTSTVTSQSVYGHRNRTSNGFVLTVEDRSGRRANSTVRVDYIAVGS